MTKRSDVSLAAYIPPLPSLQGLEEFTEAQEKAVFDLLMAHASTERAVATEAAVAKQEMRRLVNEDDFDVEMLRALAETYVRAMARLFLMQRELDAKVRGMLTPEQRDTTGTFGFQKNQHAASSLLKREYLVRGLSLAA